MDFAQMLRSEDMRECIIAIRELSTIPSDRAVAILEQLASESNLEFQARALDGMERMAPDRAEALATQFLSDPRSELHVNAIHILWKLNNRRSASLIVSVLVNSPDEHARSWAAFALGELGDASALPALANAAENDTGTNHEGQPVRETARQSIQLIRARLADETNELQD